MSVKTNQYLGLLFKLRCIFPVEQAQAGQVVSRGFADLGFEEFVIMPNGQLLSMYSGQLSKVDFQNDESFFLVPDLDQLSGKLIELGFDIIRLVPSEEGRWLLEFKSSDSGELSEVRATTIEGTFLEALSLNV